MLRKLNQRNLVLKYCLRFDAEQREAMQEKWLTSQVFGGDKKESYAQSVGLVFTSDRLGRTQFFNTMPITQMQLFNAKKYLQDANEKILVRKLFSFFKVLAFI